MKRRSTERIALQVYRARQWLARKSPGQRQMRRELHRKPALNWWLVYGPPRSGTSYMMEWVKTCSSLWVSDWSLGILFEPIPRWLAFRSEPAHDFIAFDHARFLKDLSRNILDNANTGDGSQLDLLYKQANMRPNEYHTLVQMWGPPKRTIFCLREPSGYIASATRKFAHASREQLQRMYTRSVESHLEIGGDLFEYSPELSVADYIAFLQPLNFERTRLPMFRFRGTQDHGSTSEEMWRAYHRAKELAED
jgi:hypothetical protein